MKIVVCFKQVPDTTEVRLDPVTNTLIREGVPSIINPDDKCGIEAALRIKEQIPGTTVTVLSMGIPSVDVAMREALAMGCDEAVLLSDRPLGGADTWATSTSIAAALKKMDYDLIICGRQAIDGDTAQVGPQIAEHLGIPQISYVEEIMDINEKSITVKRQFEDRYHVIEAQLPCLITCLSELNDPRYMSVGGIFDAYREKEVKMWNVTTITEGMTDEEKAYLNENIGLKGSPTNVVQSFTKQPKGKGEVHKDVSADEAVEIIVKKLAEKFII